LPYVGCGRVDRSLRAEVACERETRWAEVDGDDVLVPAVHQCGDCRKADRPAAEDAHSVARPHVRLLCGVHPDGKWFGERSDVEGELVGHTMEMAAIGVADEEVRREAALRRAVADAADLVVAGLYDHAIANSHGRHVVSNPLDGARDLVTEAQRLAARPGHAAHPDVREVCSADAARGDAHHCVASGGSGSGTSSTRRSPGPWTRTWSMKPPSALSTGAELTGNSVAPTTCR
jgi:hypothetical protein